MYSRTSNWRVNVTLLFYFFDTLIRSIWARKVNGWIGVLKYPFFIAQYTFKAILGIIVFGWRAKMFILAYTWFRRLDDVMDGDARPPKGYSVKKYVKRKKKFLRAMLDGRRVFVQKDDILLIALLEEAEYRRTYIIPEIESLWNVMYWDYQRSNTSISKSTLDKQSYDEKIGARWRSLSDVRKGLDYYAQIQDSATLCACTKVFGGDYQKVREVSIKSLNGVFTRTGWIRDIANDIRRGIVNISKEEMREYGISLPKLLASKNLEELHDVPGFSRWYQDELFSLKEDWATARSLLGRTFSQFFCERFKVPFLERMFNLEETAFRGMLKFTK